MISVQIRIPINNFFKLNSEIFLNAVDVKVLELPVSHGVADVADLNRVDHVVFAALQLGGVVPFYRRFLIRGMHNSLRAYR